MPYPAGLDWHVSLDDQFGNPINGGNPLPISGGGGGGGGAVTIVDGGDVTEGSIADVAVTGDNPGTVSAKLRGLNKILFDVWDSVNHWLKVGASQVGTWNVGLNAGSNTVGKVDQGAGGASAWKVDGSAVTQPISATALPLPTGASTEATLALIKSKTDNLDVLLSTRTKPSDTQTVSGSVSVSNFPAAEDVSDRAARLLGHTTVDNFPATQPVSGTLTANQGAAGASAWPVSISGNMPSTLLINNVQQQPVFDDRNRKLLEAIYLRLTRGDKSREGISVAIPDGSDITAGGVGDSAITGDVAGTDSAKLRGLNKILFDVWDSVNHWLRASFRYGYVATYTAANETSVSTGTVVGTNNSILYLFHPASNTKRIAIERIDVTYGGGNSGQFVLILNQITAENATPGGSTLTPVANDGNDAASTVTLRTGATGAPTRNATDTFVISAGGSSSGFFTFTSAQFPGGKPLICRAGVAEGWEVRSVAKVTLSTAALCNANMVWTET